LLSADHLFVSFCFVYWSSALTVRRMASTLSGCPKSCRSHFPVRTLGRSTLPVKHLRAECFVFFGSLLEWKCSTRGWLKRSRGRGRDGWVGQQGKECPWAKEILSSNRGPIAAARRKTADRSKDRLYQIRGRR